MRSTAAEAYDLEMFDDNKRARAQQKAKEYRVSSRKKKKTSPISFENIVLFVMVFATLGAILLSYASLTETNKELSRLKKELASVQEEGKRLSVAVEQKNTLSSIEDYARNELGMSELQSYQIEYVSVASKDKGQVIKKSGLGEASGIFKGLSQNLNAVLEYLK
jgi:cell division protein FtsB